MLGVYVYVYNPDMVEEWWKKNCGVTTPHRQGLSLFPCVSLESTHTFWQLKAKTKNLAVSLKPCSPGKGGGSPSHTSDDTRLSLTKQLAPEIFVVIKKEQTDTYVSKNFHCVNAGQ